jgi:hypothetical protein
MPKRFRPEQLAAALAAGAPPTSEEHAADEDWHSAQNDWLARWQPDTHLPDVDDPKRRTTWNTLSKQGLRHYEAAVAARAAESSSSGPAAPEAASAPAPAPAEAPASAPGAAPAATGPGTHPDYDYEWEQRMLRKMLHKRGIRPVKMKWTVAQLIAKLAAHEKPAQRATPMAMPPQQPALELASDAVRATHELREECRALGIEYSIAESAEQLTDKIRAARDHAEQ